MSLNRQLQSAAPSQVETGPQVPPGLKLIGCMGLSILAFGTRTLPSLVLLTAVNLTVIYFLKAGTADIWRETRRVLIWQTAVIVALYLIRFGLDGLWPGTRTSWQLFLAYLPGIIFMQSTPHARIVETLTKILPYKTAFVLATCIRFIPLMIGEIKSIHESQILRGARIMPRDLVRPWHWGDLIHCLLVPVIVQSLHLSEQIARAARARDFGFKDQRTSWPGQ